MAVLSDEFGCELLWLSVLCEGRPCQSTAQDDPMRFLAMRSGRLTLVVKNVGISPACFCSIHRQQMDPESAWNEQIENLVNDFDLVYRGWEERIGR